MNWSQRIRQTHRWLSVAFTAAVIVTTILSAGGEEPAAWVYIFPGGTLALLLLTGLYMFALPWVARWRSGRRAAGGGERSPQR